MLTKKLLYITVPVLVVGVVLGIVLACPKKSDGGPYGNLVGVKMESAVSSMKALGIEVPSNPKSKLTSYRRLASMDRSDTLGSMDARGKFDRSWTFATPGGAG